MTTDGPPEEEMRTGQPIPEALYESTGFLLAITGAESRRRFVQGLARWDLRPSHYGALMALAELGAMSQRELGRLIGVDPRNLVAIIDLLEARKLAERRPDPTDRRRRALVLTPAGGHLLDQLRRDGAALEQEMLAALDATERATLRSLLLRLVPAQPGKFE
jgi:DNA-binding MarR family transcriptional regulator